MSEEVIGPTLPPNWKSKEKSDDNKEDDQCVYGPTLPTGLQKSVSSKASNASTSRVIGPSIPPNFKFKKSLANDSDSDSDDMIGPIPETHHKFDKINEKFGDVSETLAQREAQKELKREREEWMTVIPEKVGLKITDKIGETFQSKTCKK